MTRGLGGAAPANVQNYLKGAHYPTGKGDLVATARSNGAPKEIIEVLESLSQDEFGGPQEVMKAYGQLDEEERKPS
ncbi:DUF2795 domain-containing protein [Sorangium sp. So ce1000]|uniref:DUF2795 domain-containing protein n=1 Tax=Sorangium sp. So ce1000 TaxID=3133325 RepID=UPI003F629870